MQKKQTLQKHQKNSIKGKSEIIQIIQKYLNAEKIKKERNVL